MNPTTQPGMHPDAESLAAFAEQALPTAEREQILAHMATCSRCREVVFLAREAAVAEEPAKELAAVSAAVPVAAVGMSAPRRRWFAGRRWVWVPVAAAAGIVGVVAVQHFRHAVRTETEMARNVAPTSALNKVEPSSVAPKSPPEAIPPVRRQAAPALPRQSAAREAQMGGAARKPDEKKPVEQKDEAVAGAGAALGVSGGLAGGSVHGMVAARAKAPSYGPMAANQFQQNSNQVQQQNLAQQDAVDASRVVPSYDANKLVTVNAAPQSAAQTVTVQPQAQSAPAPAAPPPSITLSQIANESLAVSGTNAEMKKAPKIVLPSGSGVLSSVSVAGRIIALDTAGTLFVSEDNQKHWQPVQTQWSGRAVLVRARPAHLQIDALSTVQAPRFELVTDKLQTWVSPDGKRWTAEPLPGK